MKLIRFKNPLKTSSPSVIKHHSRFNLILIATWKGDLMYLSEKKRTQIRECIGNSKDNSGIHSREDKAATIKRFRNIEGSSKVSQILFDARDGKEVFTPF